MKRPPACVLVVDDDAATRGFMRTLLNEEGYQVETAVDGLDALGQLGCSPDLILLDLQMPFMSGHEFLDQLRTMPDYIGTPVLVVTSQRDSGTIAGAQGVLRKPFETASLLRRVSELLPA